MPLVLGRHVNAFGRSGCPRPFRRNTICRWNDARRMHLRITSGKDVDKAAALEKAVTSRTTSIHRFVRNSAYYQDRPPIYVTPGSQAILTLMGQKLLSTTLRIEASKIESLPQCKLRYATKSLNRLICNSWITKIGSWMETSAKKFPAATQAGLHTSRRH